MNLRPMNPGLKSDCFQYSMHLFLEWHKEKKGHEWPNDLSILKTMKLLFFMVAADSTPAGDGVLLKQVFTDFRALPYGHVEGEIYSEINRCHGKFSHFTIDTNETRRIEGAGMDELTIEEEYKHAMDQAIHTLKIQNPDLIVMKPFDLVELSHQWFSWKSNFMKARKENKYSREIPAEDIRREWKVFRLIKA
jgi:hypothetical protein